MIRAAVSGLLGAAVLGCAGPTVLREGSVAVRPRQGDADSALVVSYAPAICSVTLRDESGRLHDRKARADGTVPIDMTRALPQHPFRRYGSSDDSSLLTVLALPPGRYTLTEYATSDELDELETNGEQEVSTDCSGGLDTHEARVPIRIEPGALTLLRLPGGSVDFPALRAMSAAVRNPHVANAVGSWLPALRRTGSAMHRELAARQRQRHDGYDVYPHCDGKVAVVRSSGRPFPWYDRAHDESARRSFRAHAPLPTRSVQATGFGNGCVKELAFVYLLTDPRELEPLSRAVGQMMVDEDLAGEIDLVLTGPIEPHPGAP